MNDQILDSPSIETRELVYAGFWIRAAAMIIDSLILGVVFGIVFGLVGALAGTSMSFIIVMYIVAIVVGLGYYVVLESSEKQGTFGKQAVGIKIGKANGERITTANAVGRLFARWLSSAILYIGYIMVAFDAKKQSLHDKLANTYVFYAK